MSTQLEDGGPAFPSTSPVFAFGMTLRDYFAGQAMAGLLMGGKGPKEEVAATAYEHADSMIEERLKVYN